VLRSASSGSR